MMPLRDGERMPQPWKRWTWPCLRRPMDFQASCQLRQGSAIITHADTQVRTRAEQRRVRVRVRAAGLADARPTTSCQRSSCEVRAGYLRSRARARPYSLALQIDTRFCSRSLSSASPSPPRSQDLVDTVYMNSRCRPDWIGSDDGDASFVLGGGYVSFFHRLKNEGHGTKTKRNGERDFVTIELCVCGSASSDPDRLCVYQLLPDFANNYDYFHFKFQPHN